jgi:hypothetical protein
MESETKPNGAHHEIGQKECLDPVKASPTLHSDIVRKADNYGLKEWMTNRFTRSAVN